MHDWAEFRHFLYLLKILEKGGFRVAAEELHTSQPNLSVQARRFQDYASIRLFSKTKNGQIQPTETGIAFISLARMVLEIREEVIDALMAIDRGGIAVIRLGSTPLVDQGLFRRFSNLHRELLPRVSVRPTHGDAAQLAREVLDGQVNAALITLPLSHPDLHVEEVRRDRIVVCLRRDHPLASKVTLEAGDLQDRLSIIYHPERHPDAHRQLIELLSDVGITLGDYSCASHPSEMQMLVKEGHGLALIREGTPLDEELTVRRLAAVNWTVDTAVIYHKQHHLKSLPILVRMLKRSIPQDPVLRRSLNVLSQQPARAIRGLRERLS